MPTERAIVNRLQAKLNQVGKVIKTEGNGEPDLVGVWRGGISYVIELKQPGKKPSELQLHRLDEWRREGAIAFWADDADEAFIRLEEAVSRKLKRGDESLSKILA